MPWLCLVCWEIVIFAPQPLPWKCQQYSVENVIMYWCELIAAGNFSNVSRNPKSFLIMTKHLVQ
jgi:hypothetical protein